MGNETIEIQVRYFAAAADAAGRETETVFLAPSADIGTLKAELIGKYGAFMEQVLTVAAFLVGSGPDAELTRDPSSTVKSSIDILPPFAGG